MQGLGKRLGAAATASVCVLLLALAPAAFGKRPNVIVIVTDDQTLESYERKVMPRTHRKLGDRGTTFTEAIVSTPQCCPSRGGFLTGQYSQNNGVTSNRPGYPALRGKRNTLPNWLRAAGYRTIHLGRFLNGYWETRGERPAPGWHTWKTVLRTDYQDPTWSIDGRARRDENRYLTSTLNRMAKREIRRNAARRKPFYLQIDHLAPHHGWGRERSRCRGGAVPKRKDENRFRKRRAPRTPAALESDLGDKPEFIQRRSPHSAADFAEADLRYGCTLGSLLEVDRGTAAVTKALRRAGVLGATMILFTSDNGFAQLEHLIRGTKGLPYEEHLRVPLVIRPPRSFPKASRTGLKLDAPVANIDLAPTILDLADTVPCRSNGGCRRMDGRSLVPLLRGRDRGWTDTRAIRTSFSVNNETYRYSCRWDGLRTPERSLINHVLLPEVGGRTCTAADEFEFYDLEQDPFQLDSNDAVPAGLRARLDRLRRCSGIARRDGSQAGRPFCE